MQLQQARFTSCRPAGTIPRSSYGQGRAGWSQRGTVTVCQARRRGWRFVKKEDEPSRVPSLTEQILSIPKEEQEALRGFVPLAEELVLSKVERLMARREALKNRDDLVYFSCYAALLTPLWVDDQLDDHLVVIIVSVAVTLWNRALSTMSVAGTRPRKRKW